MSQHEPTPYDHYFSLANSFVDQSMRLGDAARMSVQTGDLPGAVGRYEAAMARLDDARHLTEHNVRAAAYLAEQAAADGRQDAEAWAKSHPWPIEGLERDNYDPTAYPRWGIDTTNGGNGDGTVSLGRSAHNDRIAPMLLRIETCSVENEVQEATAQVTLPELRALLALAERIDAGLPVPYDKDGNAQVV